MALYSFCVKRKGENHFRKIFCSDKRNYDLQFLDFLTMQFSNKDELLYFLGLNHNEFSDVAITYKNNHEYRKLDVIYNDAFELEDIVEEMVDFSGSLQSGEPLYDLAYGYLNPKSVKIETTVNPYGWGFKTIWKAFLKNDMPKVAFRTSKLHEKAYNYYETFGEHPKLINEVCRSYLSIRKIYTCLRENNCLRATVFPKNHHLISINEMESFLNPTEAIKEKILKEILKFPTDGYSEILIRRILNGDCVALEEFMNQDAETLTEYQEFLKLLPEYLESLKESPQKRI